MKKVLAWVLSLCLLLSCVGAVAEEAIQAQVAQAFAEKASAILNKISAASGIELSVEPAGSESLTLLARQSAEAGLIELSIQAPGMEKPVLVQTDTQTIWLSVDGQVLQIAIEEIQKLLTSLSSAASMTSIDPQIIAELAQLLLTDVILPGVQAESQEGVTKIVISLSGKQMIAGAATFVDQVLTIERYRDVVLPILQQVAAQNGYTGDFAADLDAQWPAMKEQLLATETDFQLDATIEVRQAENTLVTADAAVTTNGSVIKLSLNAADDAQTLSIALNVAAAAGEQTMDLARIALDCDKASGNLKGNVTLPTSKTEVKILGNFAGNALQCQIDVYTNGALKATMHATSVAADGAVHSTCVVSNGDETTTSTFYLSKSALQCTVQGEDILFSLNAQLSAAGDVSYARIAYGDGSRDGWEVIWDGAAITYLDAENQVKISDTYRDENTYVIDIAVTEKQRAASEGETYHAYLTVVLDDTEGQEKITATLLSPTGEAALNAWLGAVEAGTIDPLAQQEPTVLTAEMLEAILMQMMAGAAQ